MVVGKWSVGWCAQTDYEQELELQRTAHRRELARNKEDIAQLLASTEASSIPVDEELVRRRYVKEIERIKVRLQHAFYVAFKN